eukprot:COSAG02_NODE_152_length_33208_cov_13.316591_4_plen_88_part_00
MIAGDILTWVGGLQGIDRSRLRTGCGVDSGCMTRSSGGGGVPSPVPVQTIACPEAILISSYPSLRYTVYSALSTVHTTVDCVRRRRG